MSGARVHIGTSGWNYRHWRGRFYPEKLRQADWLAHFAKHFGSVEVNNASYRVPGVEHVRAWGHQAPTGFRFAIKMWRGITHFKKLKNCREHLKTFFSPLAALAVSQRGPILVQLPANQGKDLEKLHAFLTDLKAVTHPARWKIAIEFRNEEWLCSETYELLDRQRAAICLQDMSPADAEWPNDAAFVYARRHGPEGDYRGAYPDAVIQQDARRIRGWRDEGRTVFIYYNNDAEACAIHDARRLEKALRELA